MDDTIPNDTFMINQSLSENNSFTHFIDVINRDAEIEFINHSVYYNDTKFIDNQFECPKLKCKICRI